MLDIPEDLQRQLATACKRFNGQATTLESALGAVFFGQVYGWRVLKIIHNPTTYSKYERILGIRFTEVCPERTELSRRSVGLKAADKLQSFWAVVRGTQPVEGKGELV